MSEGEDLPYIPADFERFTPRTAHALVRGGYRHLGDVQAASDAELLALRNFGYYSLAEVRAVDG
jgi:DNA-directed RNA polymerase alpha subunit